MEGWHRSCNEISLTDVLIAKRTITRGTAAGGGRLIVPDFLCCLPLVVSLFIYTAFHRLFVFGDVATPESWRTILLIMLAKHAFPKLFSHYRGISLLDGVAKWYSGALMCNIERQINTKCQGFACCSAYSKHRSTVEIVLVLVNVI